MHALSFNDTLKCEDHNDGLMCKVSSFLYESNLFLISMNVGQLRASSICPRDKVFRILFDVPAKLFDIL